MCLSRNELLDYANTMAVELFIVAQLAKDNLPRGRVNGLGLLDRHAEVVQGRSVSVGRARLVRVDAAAVMSLRLRVVDIPESVPDRRRGNVNNEADNGVLDNRVEIGIVVVRPVGERSPVSGRAGTGKGVGDVEGSSSRAIGSILKAALGVCANIALLERRDLG